MKKSTLWTIGFLSFFSAAAAAQCPPPGFPVAGNTCNQAPVLCQSLDGYCSTLSTNNVQQAFPGCPAYVFNNDEWFGFYAASNAISIQITPSNCVGGGANIGMQGGIYNACVNLPMDLQCPCTEDPFVLSANNFIIGKVYWLVLDGCAGDICDYSIQVLQGSLGPCAENVSVCGDSCITICDSVFCEQGVHTATCIDSSGNAYTHQFYLNRFTPAATIGGGGSITCNNPEVLLFAQGVTGIPTWYDHSGALIGAGGTYQINATTAELYTLKAVSGPCEAIDQVLVKDNTQLPDVSAAGGTLDAAHPTVQLVGQSIMSGVLYSWTGPGGFTSNKKKPTVSLPGIYTLTVTVPGTGCSNSVEVEVVQN